MDWLGSIYWAILNMDGLQVRKARIVRYVRLKDFSFLRMRRGALKLMGFVFLREVELAKSGCAVNLVRVHN